MPHQAVSCAVAPLPPMACAHGCHGGLVQRPPVLARAHMRAAGGARAPGLRTLSEPPGLVAALDARGGR